MPNKDDQKIIVRSNELIEARYKLTIEEQRLVLLLSSTIRSDDEDFKDYEIRVSDFVAMFGLEKRKAIYKAVEEAARELAGKKIDLSRGGKKIYASWLSYVEYVEGSGVVKLRFDKSLKPYLLQLNENFTKYNLQHVMQFKSSYSIRLYELLKMEAWKAKNGQFEKTFELADYRDKIGIEKKAYPIFADFKKRVIEPTTREVSDQTDLHIFETRYIKTGRKITGVCFVVLIRGKDETKLRQDNLRIEDIKEGSDEIHPTIQALMENGFTIENAKNYKAKFGLKQIERNLAYMLAEQKNGKVINNKAGYLSKAIQEDWGKPWVESEEAKAKKAKQRKQEEKQKKEEQTTIEQQIITKYRQAFEQYEGLGNEEKMSLKLEFMAGADSFTVGEMKKSEKKGESPFTSAIALACFKKFLVERGL